MFLNGRSLKPFSNEFINYFGLVCLLLILNLIKIVNRIRNLSTCIVSDMFCSDIFNILLLNT